MKLREILESKLLDVPTLTVEQLAKKHKMSVQAIEKCLAKGVKHEKEHSSDPKVAMEIALDHLKEDPAYYDKLEKAIPES